VGTVVFSPVVDGKTVRAVEFTRVLHVPDLRNNLLSVLYLTCNIGFTVHINSSQMSFERPTGTPLFVATISGSNAAFLDGSTLPLAEYASAALDILERFGMSDCKPISTPMQPNSRLSRSQCPQTPEEVEFMKTIPYLAAVGALMYLATSTRPDIAYTVGCLARFNSNPGIVHWHAVKHLLHYLKGTADYSITYHQEKAYMS
jgi:hypothetical protein